MCASDRPHLLSGFAFDQSAADSLVPDLTAAPKRRIKLWEITDQIHCSVIGTCLSATDLRKLARKVAIRIEPGAADYDIHGYFVKASTENSAFTRAVHKLLDERYEGAVRRVARAKTAEELAELWTDMRDRGQIAPAYWAFMTHAHISSEMRNLVFGEVHMLSHLAGTSYRKKTVEMVILRDQLQDIADRAQRVENGLRQAVEERDQEIERLRAEITHLKAAATPAPLTASHGAKDRRKVSQRLDKMERALVSARVRARRAESQEKQLKEQLHCLSAGRDRLSADAIQPFEFAAGEAQGNVASLSGKVFLYVGGRSNSIERLRSVAAEYDAQLRHHDGGLEQTPQRLDRLLPSVDCVLCPIDCVSHDACLRAKKACQKLEKPFVPLRSASLASFRTALERLAAPAAGRTTRGD